MPKFKLIAMTSALLAGPFLMAGMVHAQTATQDQTETSEETAQGTTEETLQIGSTYIKSEFEDWALRCIVTAEGEHPCQMYQLLTDSSGSPIAEFTMLRLPEGQVGAAAATIVVPLETDLQKGLRITVDENPPQSYPFNFCNPNGCYSRVGLRESDVAAFKQGAEAKVSITPIAAPDQTVSVTMSLSGFTAAYDVVSELRN